MSAKPILLLKRIFCAERLAKYTSKGRFGKMSIVPQAIIDWLISNMPLWDSINHRSAAEDANVNEACVHDCTVIGRAKRQSKYLRRHEHYAVVSSLRHSWKRDMTFGSGMSIASNRKRIGEIPCLVGKMPWIPLWMYDVKSNRSIAKFSTIPNTDLRVSIPCISARI